MAALFKKDTTLSYRDEAGTLTALHPLWVRERSTDAQSLDPASRQRLYNPDDLPADLSILAIEADDGDLTTPFFIRWSDGERLPCDPSMLLAETMMTPGTDGLPAPQSWMRDTAPDSRMRWSPDLSPESLFAMTGHFLRHGFLILGQVPAEDRAVLQVARTFGFPRDTNWGLIFDVRSVPDANDLAYTALHLDPHTDNPYRQPVPGIQLLHCLINETQGGLSTFVDGRAVAEALRERDPAAWDILTSQPVRFHFTDRTTEHVDWSPYLECDTTGSVAAVRYSHRLDYVPLRDAGALTEFYRARRLFLSLLRAPEFELRLRLDQGEVAMFDNRRLLHGRTAFDPSEGRRHLQGCYIDIDGPRSLYRVLARDRNLCDIAA